MLFYGSIARRVYIEAAAVIYGLTVFEPVTNFTVNELPQVLREALMTAGSFWEWVYCFHGQSIEWCLLLIDNKTVKNGTIKTTSMFGNQLRIKLGLFFVLIDRKFVKKQTILTKCQKW